MFPHEAAVEKIVQCNQGYLVFHWLVRPRQLLDRVSVNLCVQESSFLSKTWASSSSSSSTPPLNEAFVGGFPTFQGEFLQVKVSVPRLKDCFYIKGAQRWTYFTLKDLLQLQVCDCKSRKGGREGSRCFHPGERPAPVASHTPWGALYRTTQALAHE